MGVAELTFLASKYRGTIINLSIHLERMIDIVLARYFCPTDDGKATELLNLILATDRIVFDNKRQIMEYIFKDNYPDFIKDNPDFFNDLERRIIPKRNIFAHYLLDISEEARSCAKEKIGFQKFKNDNKTVWYTHDEILAHVDLINKNILILLEFMK